MRVADAMREERALRTSEVTQRSGGVNERYG